MFQYLKNLYISKGINYIFVFFISFTSNEQEYNLKMAETN